MLVLTRKDGESITIGDDVKVTVQRRGTRVRLVIDAPRSISVNRSEILDRNNAKKED